jgi:pyruvyltransferase
MKVWAWRGPKIQNLGDELGIALCERVGLKVERVDLIEQADLITIGSILNSQRIRAGTMVWGSGFIKPPFNIGREDLQYLALRGEVTKEICFGARMRNDGGNGCGKYDLPLGDPGLLVSRYWPRGRRNHWKVGVVPHYVDKRKFAWADKVIDVTAPVDEVIKDISECAVVMSSSLHGLIVAESFGIPAMRLYHPEVIGGDFKWADYISARTHPLNEIQQNLLNVLGAIM